MDISAWDEQFDEAAGMVASIFKSPGYHSLVPSGTRVHETRLSLDYALVLLETGQTWRKDRAASIIEKVLSMQDTEPTSPGYGIWPWLLEEPLAAMRPFDRNWADFLGRRLACVLVEHADVLNPDLIVRIREALGHAAWCIFRQNIQPDYTNIAIMGAGVTLAAGEILGEPRLVDYGRRRLKNIAAHTAYNGEFTEYNSPQYTVIALDECEHILRLVRDAEGRDCAETLRRVAWRTIAEHYHPGTGEWAGPHCRAYSERLQDSTLAGATSIDEILQRPIPCPPELLPRFSALPEPEYETHQSYIKRETKEDSVTGVTWFSEDACLGTASRSIMIYQRHPLIGYWKTNSGPAVVLRLRFLHDGRDFGSAYIRSAQVGPRVISAINFVTDGGDYSGWLDAPTDGTFTAADFRVSYELSGDGVSGKDCGNGRFILSAGSHHAMVQCLPGLFYGREVQWRLAIEHGKAAVEGICYAGEPIPFTPAQMGRIVLATALEVSHDPQPEFGHAPIVHHLPGDRMQIDWAGNGLTLTAPARPEVWLRP